MLDPQRHTQLGVERRTPARNLIQFGQERLGRGSAFATLVLIIARLAASGPQLGGSIKQFAISGADQWCVMAGGKSLSREARYLLAERLIML